MTKPIMSFFNEPIRIAAKSGFLSKRVWAEFMSSGNVHWKDRRWQNRQWKKLTDSGLFTPLHEAELIRPVLALTDTGKSLAHASGFDPVYSPPVANLWHDEELIRFALGFERQGWMNNWTTEQELKVSERGARFFKNQIRAQKIPDLVLELKTPKGPTLWAIELERSRKQQSRYNEMVAAYKGISGIDLVLMIAATDSIEANIVRAQGKMSYPQNQRPMLLTSMNDFLNDPLSSELRQGTKKITLEKLVQAVTGISPKTIGSKGKTIDPGVRPAWVNSKAVA